MSTAPVEQAIRRITDLKIVPGTLNVVLPEPFDAELQGYISQEELSLHRTPELAERKGIRYDDVLIEGRFRGIVFQGDEPGYNPQQVELMSDHNLREALGLRDDDTIEFRLTEKARE